MGASKAQVRLADDEDVILVHGVGLCALLFVSIVAQARVRPYPQAFQNRLVLRLQVALLVIVALSMVSMLTPVTLEFVWSSLSFGCIAASTLYTMLALTHLHGGFDALLQSCCSLGRKKPSSPAQPAPVPLEGEVFDARYKPQACWVAPLTDPRTTGSSAVDGTDGLRRRVRKQYPGGSGGPTTPLPEDDTEASPRDLRDQWRDSYDVADGIEGVVEGVRRSGRKPVQPPPPANKQEAHAERWWEQGDQQQAIPPPEASVGGSQFRSTWKPQACWAAPLPEPAAVDHALEQERLEREAREARRQLMQLMQNQQRMSQAQERKEQLEKRFRERLGLDDDDDDDDDDEYLAWRADQEGGVRLPPSKAAKLGGRDREDRLDGWLESGTGASREGPGRMIQQKQLEAKWWNLEADKHSLATKLAGVDREDRLDGWLESGTGALREGPGRRVADKHSLIRQVEGGQAAKLGGRDREDRLDGWLESGTGASREGPGRRVADKHSLIRQGEGGLATKIGGSDLEDRLDGWLESGTGASREGPGRLKIHALATEAKQRMVEAEWLLIQSLNDDAPDVRADVPKSSAGKGRPEKRRLIVQAIVHMPSKDASESASAVLCGDTTQLSAALGVTIISIDVLASSPEPPSSPPPSPPPPSPPSSPFPSPRQSPPLPSPPPSPPPPGAPGAGYFLTANITIAGDPSDFTDAVDLEFRTKLANLLGVNLGDIRLVRDVRWVRATTKRAFSQRLAELEADGNVDAGYIEDVKLSFAQKLAAIEAVVGDMEDGHATFREDGAVATKEGAGRRNERSGRPPMDPHERRAMQEDAQLAAEQKLLEAEWLMLESQKLARAEERAEMRAVGSAASRDGAGRRREGWASGDLRAFARSMQPKLDEADGGDGAPANDSDLAAMQKVLEAKWLLAEIQRLPTETTDSLDGDSELPAQQEVDEARQRLAELESKERIEALKDAELTIEQKVLEARQLLAELEKKERAEALKSEATKDRPARSSRDISVAFAPTQAAALKVIKQQVLDVRQRLARLTIEQKVLEARERLAELEKKERAEALKSKATKGRPTRAIPGADGAGAAIEGAALFAIQQEVDEARQRLAELEQERAEALKSEATKGRPTRAIRDADGAGAAIEGAPLMTIKQEVDEARQRLAELVQERAEVPKSRAGKERPVRTLAARVHDAMVSIPAAELFLAEAAKLAGRDREDRLDGWLESGTGASREGPGRLKEARPAKLADRSLRMQIAAELRPVTPSLSSKLQATGSRKDEERAEMRAVGSAASKEGAGRRREGGASLSAIARSMQPKLLEARELLAQLEKDERAEAIKLESQKARRVPMTESAALKVLEARSAALKQRVLEARQRLAELEKAAGAVDDGGTDVLVGEPPYALADSEAGIQMQRDALRLLLEAESMMPGCSGGLSSELRLTHFGLVDRESERKAFREEWAAVPSNATKDRPGRYMAAAAARVAGKMLTSAIKAILTSDLDDEETRNAQASSLVHGLSEGLTHASSIVLNLSGLADQRIMGPRGSRDEEERADRVGSQKERAGRLPRARPQAVSTPSTVGGGYLQQTRLATQARKLGKMIAGRLRSDETSTESGGLTVGQGGIKRSPSDLRRAYAERKKGSRKDLLSGAGVNAAAPRCFKSAQPPMLRKGLSFRGKRPDDDTLDELADREGEIIGAGRNRTKGSGIAWGPLRYTKQKIVARKLAQKIGAASPPPPAILRQPGFDKTASFKGRFFSMLEPKTQSDSIWHMAALHRISERASGHGRASGRVSIGDLPNQGSGRLWKAGSSKMLLKTSSGRSLLDLIDKDEWEAARNDTDKQEQLAGKTAEERKKTLVERAEKLYKFAMEAALKQTAALTFSELLELERSERPLQIVIEGFAGELLPAPRRTLLQRWGLRSVPMTVMLKMVHKDAPVKVELLTASTKSPLAKPFRLKTVVDAADTARKKGMLAAEREAASVLSQLHKPSAIDVDEESIIERRSVAPRRPLMRELAPLSDGYAKGEARKEKAPSLRKGGGPTVIAPQELLLTTNGSGKSLATPEASTTDAQPSEAQKAEKAPETLRLIEGTGTSPERSKPLSADKAKRAENLAELNEKLKEKMQSRVEQSMARQEQVLDTRQRIQRAAKEMPAPARPPAPGTVGSGRMDRTAASDAASATPATPPASRAAFLQRLKRTPSGLHVNAAKAILPMLPLSTSDDSPATSRAPETSRDPTRKTAAADVIKKKRAAQALNVGSSKNVLAACNTSERSTSSDESPATSRAPETSRLPKTSRDKFKKASKSHGSSKNVLGTSGRNSPSVLSEPSARLSESSDAALSNDGDVLDA